MAKNDNATAISEMEAFYERAQIAQAPAWRPEVGDVLTGEIIGFRLGHTSEFGDYPIIVFRTSAGPISFHCFHGIVRDRLRELKPSKGDNLTVQYLGKRLKNGDEDKPPADQTHYHLYYIESSTVDATPVLDTIEF